MSVPAGPPSGGLYLKPPSDGGLCDGVTTMPSAREPLPEALWTRIALDTAGVGVYPPRASSSTRTPLAASTSSALTCAGSDRAWVSAPRYSRPPGARTHHVHILTWARPARPPGPAWPAGSHPAAAHRHSAEQVHRLGISPGRAVTSSGYSVKGNTDAQGLQELPHARRTD